MMPQLQMNRIGSALSAMSQTLLRTSEDIGDSGRVALRTEICIVGNGRKAGLAVVRSHDRFYIRYSNGIALDHLRSAARSVTLGR